MKSRLIDIIANTHDFDSAMKKVTVAMMVQGFSIISITQPGDIIWPVLDKPRMSQPVPKRFCHFCHGFTPDDSRGACIACGGPRYE